jgi:hypothetical protein
MSSVRLSNITPDTPTYLIKRHIATLMGEVCELSHQFNIEDWKEWDEDEYY